MAGLAGSVGLACGADSLRGAAELPYLPLVRELALLRRREIVTFTQRVVSLDEQQIKLRHRPVEWTILQVNDVIKNKAASPQILDDVSSELDGERNRALMDYLGATTSQVLMTTTDPEPWLPTLAARHRIWRVSGGTVDAEAAESTG